MLRLWVKNVNNQRIVDSKSSVRSSTYLHDVILNSISKDVQVGVIHPNEHFLYNHSSTSIFKVFNPLFMFYTHNPHPLLLNPTKKN